MVIIDKLRQTGAEFNTQDLKYFLSQSRKKTKHFRNNQAPIISATAPNLDVDSYMGNLTPEEEA